MSNGSIYNCLLVLFYMPKILIWKGLWHLERLKKSYIAAEEAEISNIKVKCCVENKKSVTKKLEEWIIK